MKVRPLQVAALLLAAGLLPAAAGAEPQPSRAAGPAAPRVTEAERRAAELVARMTREEKVTQLINVSPAIERLNVPFIGTLLKRTEDILSFRSGGKRQKVIH